MSISKSLFALCLMTTTALADGHILDRPVEQGQANAEFTPAFTLQTRAGALADPGTVRTEVIARGLEHPWGVALLPDGSYLVTERPGRLRHITADGQISAPIPGLPDIAVQGQGGLLDIALSEDFASSGQIFFTYAKPVRGGAATALATAQISPNRKQLANVTDLFVQSPGVSGGRHFGSRVVLDGDYLFVTVGDRGAPPDSQDLGSSSGAVHRVTLDGAIPADNPFVGQNGAQSSIFSYGHRNPQGAALNPATGDLWTLEHGPKGGDELNRIEPSANYGWPVVSYGESYRGAPIGSGASSASGLTEPRYYWDPVIAPGDFTFYDGDLFDWDGDVIAASLRPGGIVRLTMEDDRVTGEARYLTRELGRVRDVAVAADGALIVLTDYDDGAIVRVTPGE